MDFVFDLTTEGRVIKCLTIVEDATHESVTMVAERAIGSEPLTRILDRIGFLRRLPKVIRTDNGREFCDRAMLNWAHRRDVQLQQIQPGKPNQNAYIELFNGRFLGRTLNSPATQSGGTSEAVAHPHIRAGYHFTNCLDIHRIRFAAVGVRLYEFGGHQFDITPVAYWRTGNTPR